MSSLAGEAISTGFRFGRIGNPGARVTRATNARLAGFMFLFCIATGIAALVLFQPVESAAGTAAKLVNIAEHSQRVRVTIMLSLLTIFEALVLAAALYAITRDQDPDLAVLALSCRVGAAALGAIGIVATLGLLWLSTTTAATAPDFALANAIAALLLKVRAWSWSIGGTLFAVGSALDSYLFVRARSIPLPLAWLGLLGSILLAVLLPAQIVGFIGGPLTGFMWIPIAVLEVALGLWLLMNGVTAPATASSIAWSER